MILEKCCQNFLQKLFVFIVIESFEEINDILGNGEFESPFFIVETALNHRYQVFDSILFTDNLTQIHYPLHDADPNHLIFILYERSHNGYSRL